MAAGKVSLSFEPGKAMDFPPAFSLGDGFGVTLHAAVRRQTGTPGQTIFSMLAGEAEIGRLAVDANEALTLSVGDVKATIPPKLFAPAFGTFVLIHAHAGFNNAQCDLRLSINGKLEETSSGPYSGATMGSGFRLGGGNAEFAVKQIGSRPAALTLQEQRGLLAHLAQPQ